MASKNISVRSDLYNKLVKLKQKGESFSEVIERLPTKSALLTLNFQKIGPSKKSTEKSLSLLNSGQW